jgi:uncharacterized lipoprotein YmbA
VKPGTIFARKTTWRSRLDLEYLDETSSRKFSARQQQRWPGKNQASPAVRQVRLKLSVRFTQVDSCII